MEVMRWLDVTASARAETARPYNTVMSKLPTSAFVKGRGALSNTEGRFQSTRFEPEDDGWYRDEEIARPATEIREEVARSVITRNDSPDVGFDQAINPFRGCEHGCAYCYARPSHAYLNLSPGLDFETKLSVKTNLVDVLRKELAKPGYVCSPINIGSNTDVYQPIERTWRLTRGALELLSDCNHPCTIVTKNALVERDLDILTSMAERHLVHVFISVNSLDNRLASKLEPRASAPHRRLQAVKTLHNAGVPVGVLVAPIIPALNERDLEEIIERAAANGACSVGYTCIRLPHELKQLFREWLDQHYPDRASHIMSLIRQMNGGQDYDSDFATRMRGQGVFADLIRKRVHIAARKAGLNKAWTQVLDTSKFRPYRSQSPQGELF
jgi:DNA repair photolyase